MADNPYIQKVPQITPEGKRRLQKAITNTEGNVYAFTGHDSPVLAAAAMARLSRRGDDMRITYLDEFAGEGIDADNLIHRVVTAYGDDSVQQLVGVHLVVENASNLLTKLLEWGRLGSYLEQSTRYIFFDTTDINGRYKYFTPANLSPEITRDYETTMDELFGLYSSIVRRLTDYVRTKHPEPENKSERTAWLGATRAQACDAVRQVLPVATKSTVGLFVSAQAADSLIMHLLSEPLEEARTVGAQLLDEARKVIPAFLERTDIPERGGATTAYRATIRENLRKLASELTPATAESGEPVELLRYWPQHESDIIAELLFEQSNQSLRAIAGQVAGWSEERKRQVFDTAVGTRLNRRHKPGRALEVPHYEFQVTGDYGTFRDLQRHRIVDAFEWQRLTPELGYDVPELVVEAGFEADYRKCFELGHGLYSRIQAAGYEVEAQYATLLGHKMRYRFMLNARAAFHFIELRTSPQGHPGYRKISQQMYEHIQRVHPMIAGAMKFINKDEDPELTRMAAELATQYKLDKLSKES